MRAKLNLVKKNIFLFLFIASFNLLAHEGHDSSVPCSEGKSEVISESESGLIENTNKALNVLSAKEFYKKFKKTSGLNVKGSSSIEDDSLTKAVLIIEKMISKRPDIRERLIRENAEVVIIAKNENYCDIPEARDLKDKKTFDGRSFCDICGGGGVIGRPITTVCEDNLLKTKNDPYHGTEDILTHEFAHTMHIMGMNEADKKNVTKLYEEAKKNEVFLKNADNQPTYMMANEQEFFACLSAAWFGVHNPKSPAISPDLQDRNSIKEKLPAVYDFMKTIYPE